MKEITVKKISHLCSLDPQFTFLQETNVIILKPAKDMYRQAQMYIF